MMAQRGRPKGSKTKPKPVDKSGYTQRIRKREAMPKKVCTSCGKNQSISNYYVSFNKQLHPDGLLPYCKTCLIDLSIDPITKEIDEEKLRHVLQMCDRPYDPQLINSMINETKTDYGDDYPVEDRSKAAIRKIFRSINSLPQYKCSYDDFERKKQYQAIIETGQGVAKEVRNGMEQLVPVYNTNEEEDESFEVTPELIMKWGAGYTKSLYQAFERKYNFLIQSYANYSSLHEEALLAYIRFKVHEEVATAAGRVDEASQWSALAAKSASNAKINPSQIAEQNDGGFSFSEFNAAIERASDVVRVLPRFKAEANDSVDLCLYVYINYVRSLNGLPPVQYEEIYKFYDDAVEAYKRQYGDTYGIFKEKNNPTLKNRKAVGRFVDVPEDSPASFFSGEV